MQHHAGAQRIIAREAVTLSAGRGRRGLEMKTYFFFRLEYHFYLPAHLAETFAFDNLEMEDFF